MCVQLEHYMAISSASGAREQCNFVIKYYRNTCMFYVVKLVCRFTDCMSLAVRSMTTEEAQKYVKLVERAQEMSKCKSLVFMAKL